jgi:drug/metabolite transporter (DMT)-like permease
LARVALGLVCFFWGTTYLAIRVGVQDMPPLLFCATRFVIASLAMGPMALAAKERLPRGREWLDLAIAGTLLLGVGNSLLSWAAQWVPIGIASLVIVTTPLWMAAFAWVSGENVRRRAVAGLCLGFLGLGAALWPQIAAADPKSGFVEGICALLLSSISWAVGSVYSKKRPVGTGPLMSATIQMSVSSLIFVVAGLALGELPRYHPTASSAMAVLYLVVFGSIVGYGSYVYALSKLPTTQVAVYAYVNTLVAITLGVLFLGEAFSPSMGLGAPLVLFGVYLVNTKAAPAAESALPVES